MTPTSSHDRAQEPILVRWLLAILGTLVSAGIIGTLTVAFRINTQLGSFSAGQAGMAEQIRGLTSLVTSQSISIKEMSVELKDARGTVQALEILTERISSNHSKLQEEVVKIRDRLTSLEQQRP